MKQIQDMTQPQLDRLMQGLALQLVKYCEANSVEKPQFALVVFNDPREGHYVANCRRDTVVDALRETADRLAEAPRPPDQQARPAIQKLRELGYEWDGELLQWRQP